MKDRALADSDPSRCYWQLVTRKVLMSQTYTPLTRLRESLWKRVVDPVMHIRI